MRLLRSKGEGILTTLIYLGVTAIVASAIAYAIWATLSTQTSAVKTLITNTIH